MKWKKLGELIVKDVYNDHYIQFPDDNIRDCLVYYGFNNKGTQVYGGSSIVFQNIIYDPKPCFFPIFRNIRDDGHLSSWGFGYVFFDPTQSRITLAIYAKKDTTEEFLFHVYYR